MTAVSEFAPLDAQGLSWRTGTMQETAFRVSRDAQVIDFAGPTTANRPYNAAKLRASAAHLDALFNASGTSSG
jgi:hypothetical protein